MAVEVAQEKSEGLRKLDFLSLQLVGKNERNTSKDFNHFVRTHLLGRTSPGRLPSPVARPHSQTQFRTFRVGSHSCPSNLTF